MKSCKVHLIKECPETPSLAHLEHILMAKDHPFHTSQKLKILRTNSFHLALRNWILILQILKYSINYISLQWKNAARENKKRSTGLVEFSSFFNRFLRIYFIDAVPHINNC